MEVKLPKEPDSDAKWVNHSLRKLPDLSEYLKENQIPNSKKSKEKPNASNKLAPISTDFSEVLYESFHIKIPPNLASIDYVMKSLSQHRRTRSINDLSNHFMNSSLSNYSREIDRCTSERWAFESGQKSVVSNKLPKCPSYFSKFSPELGSKSTGILRNKVKDGLPSFEFSIKGEGGEFYVANPLKVNNLSTKGLDYIYLFHKGVFRKKGLKFVGILKVSSSLILNLDRSNYVETEFVLFNPIESDFPQMKNTGFTKKALEILRPNYSFNKSKTIKGGKFNESSVADESLFTNSLSYEFPTNYESCAIITKNYQRKNNEEELLSAGWGLKFLKKEEICKKNRDNYVDETCGFNMEMSVLLPSGVHGSPVNASGAPSSLIERWKSGGLCDCGGWDLGCPINVLRSPKFMSEKENLPRVESRDCSSIDLFLEGSSRGDPTIKLVKEKGLNMVFFNPSVSALQCFSVGIAFLHSTNS